MNKPFKDSEVDHLLSFIGYGNISAPIGFLGMEEAGGGFENLQNRLTFDQVEDLYHGHKKLGILKYHEGSRYIQSTWRGMCLIILHLMGREISRDEIRRFQAEELGRTHSNTFLLELMPLPKPSLDAWGYSGFLPQFESKDDYYQQILPKRIQHIQSLISEQSPDIVIGYGKGYWRYYRKLFPKSKFSRNKIYEIAEGKPFVLLTHHFTARSLNGRLPEIAQYAQDGLNASTQH
mgnify:CR=1 FL=1